MTNRIARLLGPALVLRLALPIDLPVAGLTAEVDLALGVESRWDAQGGADWLTLSGQRRYRVDVAGMTAGDCPMVAPQVRVIGGADWIVDAGVSCRVIGSARLRVERIGEPVANEDTLLAALGESFAQRRVGTRALPPPHGPVGGQTTLPITGLSLTLPDDALWRVSPAGERDHDGLARLVPALPEVQVVVRRHARAELSSCAAMKRRLLAGGWVAGDVSKIEIFVEVARNRFAGFESIAYCAERGGELLDVRVASLPAAPPQGVASLLAALAVAGAERPPLPSVLAGRDAAEVVNVYGAVLAGALLEQAPASSEPDAVLGVELGFAWAMRDGLAITARGRLGHDGGGLAGATSLEVGASVVMARDLALVLSLGWLEQRDALLHNRALGLAIELRRGWFARQGLRWSLRVAGINLASIVPVVLGAPLEIAWQGELDGGLVLGLGLRSANSAVRDGAGVELVVRVGWGTLWR